MKKGNGKNKWFHDLPPEMRAEVAAKRDLAWLRRRFAEVRAETAKTDAAAEIAAEIAEAADKTPATSRTDESKAEATAIAARKEAETTALAARLQRQRELLDVVDGVYQFLLALGLSKKELKPLGRLMWAIEDHTKGKENPLIAVNRRPGQRAHTVDQMFKVFIAALVEGLIRAGAGKNLARKKAAELAAADGFKISLKNATTWHHEISNNRADFIDQSMFDLWTELFCPGAPEPKDREKQIQAVLDSAQRTLPTLLTEKL